MAVSRPCPAALAWRWVPVLFCTVWKKKRKTVSCSLQAQVLNLFVAGVVQREQAVIPQSSAAQSLAIVDVSENLRAKIYALFARLGFSDLPGLSTDDYVTLAIIEKYLDFKV